MQSLDPCCWDLQLITMPVNSNQNLCSNGCMDCVACLHQDHTMELFGFLSNNAMMNFNTKVRAIFRGGVEDGLYTCHVFSKDIPRRNCSSVYYVSILGIQAEICLNQYPNYPGECENRSICDHEVS